MPILTRSEFLLGDILVRYQAPEHDIKAVGLCLLPAAMASSVVAPDAPTVSEQETLQDSLLHFTRKLIALRTGHSGLGNDAAFRPLYAEAGKYPFVYERSDATARFAIAVNPGEPERSVDLLELNGAQLILAEGATLSGTTLALNGVSFAIFKLKSV